MNQSTSSPRTRIALDAVPAPGDLTDDQAETLAALDDALQRLDEADERLCRVVECRFLAGMSIADAAAELDISPATVKRDWVLARAWLYRELQPRPTALNIGDRAK